MKRVLSFLLAVVLVVMVPVVAFADSNATATDNFHSVISLFRPASDYVGKDIFSDLEFSTKFWELYGEKFTNDKFFHISLIVDSNSKPLFTSFYVFDVSTTLKRGEIVSGEYTYNNVVYPVLTARLFNQKGALLGGSYGSLERSPDGSFVENSSSYIDFFVYGDEDYRFNVDLNSLWNPPKYNKYLCNYYMACSADFGSDTFTYVKWGSNGFLPDIGFPPVDPPPGGDYSAKITLPRDGFKQAKLNSVALLINYKVPYDGDMKKVGIKIDGYRKDRPNDILSHDVKVSPDGSILEGFLRVAGAVPWNVETALKVEITDYTGRVYSDSVTVTCFDDFVDANGDGKDDRTNEDEWEGNPDYGDPDNPSIGGGVLPDMAGVIDSISGFTSGFVNMLASFFTFLPGEIIALLVFGIAVLIVLRIIGR